MIKITNNIETKVVTQGAYENFYKPLGFEPISSKKTTIEKEHAEKIVEEKNEEKVIQKDEKVVEKESLKEEKENFKRK